MKAFFKGIEVLKGKEFMQKHPIRMVFSESVESDELYYFGTTIEDQFCTIEEYDLEEGLSDIFLAEKINYVKSLVGITFEINLYKFTVKDLTKNKYIAFDFIEDFDSIDSNIIKDYHIASYMTKEDVILNQKYIITMQGLNNRAYGVLPDKSTEKISAELFFKPILEKKHFEIPYDKYPNLNAHYIMNEVPIKEFSKGRHLAYQIKDRDIPEYDFDKYIHQIEDYRLRVKSAKMTNNSFRKKLFFWEPKEVVKELILSPDVISMLTDCIILGRIYPSDCEEADKIYTEECEKKLRKKYMNENVDKNEFIKKWFDFKKTMRKKYQGKSVIKVAN